MWVSTQGGQSREKESTDGSSSLTFTNALCMGLVYLTTRVMSPGSLSGTQGPSEISASAKEEKVWVWFG